MMRRALAAVGLILALGCGDSGQPPSGAGDLLVAYHAGNGDAGAMVLTITGGAVESVSAIGAHQVSFSTPYPTTTRVVVIGVGELATGDLLRIRVPDVSKVTIYVVRADQVADRTSFALISPSQHTFTVHP